MSVYEEKNLVGLLQVLLKFTAEKDSSNLRQSK